MKLNLTQTYDYEFEKGLDYEDFTRVSMYVDCKKIVLCFYQFEDTMGTKHGSNHQPLMVR